MLMDGENVATQTCRQSRPSSPAPIPYESRLPLLNTSNHFSSSTVETTYHEVHMDQFCDAILGPSIDLTQPRGNNVPKEYLDAFHEYNASLETWKDASNSEALLVKLFNSALDELPSPSLRCYAQPTKGLEYPNDFPETVMGFRYEDLDSCSLNESSLLDPVVVAVDLQSAFVLADDNDDEDEGDIQPPYLLQTDFAAQLCLPPHASRLQSYALKISSSGTRRHVLGMLVRGTWLSFYVFDPSGGAYTQSLNLLSDSKNVIDILKRIALCDVERLGLDPAFISNDMRSHTALATLLGNTTVVGGHRVT